MTLTAAPEIKNKRFNSINSSHWQACIYYLHWLVTKPPSGPLQLYARTNIMLNEPCIVKFATYIQLTRFNGVSLPLQTATWEGWAVTSTTSTNGKASPSVQGKAFTTEWKHSRRKEKKGSLNSSWILGQAWSLIKWYVNFLLHQHYSQENWNILTKKKKIGDFIVE